MFLNVPPTLKKTSLLLMSQLKLEDTNGSIIKKIKRLS